MSVVQSASEHARANRDYMEVEESNVVYELRFVASDVDFVGDEFWRCLFSPGFHALLSLRFLSCHFSPAQRVW
jgi:hypothetical protein